MDVYSDNPGWRFSRPPDFYRKVANMDEARIKTIWSELVFTGKATQPKEYKSNATDDPKAIDYIDKSAVDGTAKVILTLP